MPFPNEYSSPRLPQFRKWNIVFYFIVFLLLSFSGKAVSIVTDFFWYKEIGFDSFFTKMVLAKLSVGATVFLTAFAFLYANLWTARRVSRLPLPTSGQSGTFSSQQWNDLKPFAQKALTIFCFLTAYLMAQRSAGQWELFLKSFFAAPFGQGDPLFNLDIGFYIFKLPLYRLTANLGLGLVTLSGLIVTADYFFNGRIILTHSGPRLNLSAKVHLSILCGLLSLLIAFYLHLHMYDLLFKQREIAPGAGFADIKAYLPGLKALRYLALLMAVICWLSPWLANGRVLAGTGAALLLGLLAIRTYAETVQKFQVAPNEIVKETPYLLESIRNTRQAYGITDVQELEFNPELSLTREKLKNNDLTIKNIRLWEHQPLLTSYGQLQEIRTYYDFLDADNDRYMVDGEYRQIMISARELSPESLPSRIWINEHLTYTHGYGVCLGPVNQISPEGLPEFFIKDIPPASNFNLSVSEPAIYYGEARAEYAVVNTASKEFDYPSGDENVYTSYRGTGGVRISNNLLKLLFALRFGEMKLLFSKDIGSQSKILFYRQIRERLNKAAPFLQFESDPYLVINQAGKLIWIIDGYCLSDLYPYAAKTGNFNYIRNSIKATVDAYNGTVRLYVSDPRDPIILTYQKIFPKIFHGLEEMPPDLREHIRYPAALMSIQAQIYATYHMTDPQVFYNKEDLWRVPLRTAAGSAIPMEPYYTIMKLAGVGEKEEFILMAPFTPAKKENMISWMAARCDGPQYGKLLVYNFPKQKLVYGPQQIESRIDQDAEISKQLTLWDQGGSRVIRGSMLVIPVDQSLLFVQPLYLEASGGGLPELKRIIVVYGNVIVMEENLELCLKSIFGNRPGESGSAQKSGAPIVSANLKELARQANEHFSKAQRSLGKGDWSAFGEEMRAASDLIKRLSNAK